MDPRYESFTIADPAWYEPLDCAADADSRFPAAVGEVPRSWRRADQGVWVLLAPEDGVAIPEQGWKVHVSATPANAADTIDTVWQVCRRLGLPWKFLRSPLMVTVLNTKYANRASSGKAVTVYPRTEDELTVLLTELDDALGGAEGPYVLSDLRWNQGPASVRYGAFVPMWCELPDGTLVPAVRDPDGQLVPDVRRPVFTVPEWAELPEIVRKRMAGQEAANGTGAALIGGYRITKALHFSNGGGVYLAQDEQGREIVLKEARPHAGLDGTGADAVTRLAAEYEVLRSVRQLPFVPEVHGCFTVWEHHYLAMEYVPGEPLSAWLGAEFPLVRHRPGPETRARFAALAVERMRQVEDCVGQLHDAGVAFGDLHPRNIMIRPDGTVALVDYELAVPVDSERRAALGAVGFTDPALSNPREADLFALGCCQLGVLMPLTAVLVRNPSHAGRLVRMAKDEFPTVPPEFFDRMTQRLALSPDLRPHLQRAAAPLAPVERSTLVRGIAAAARIRRTDRLFPGDVDGHRPGGALGLAHGASGVLLAQDALGIPTAPEHVDWLAEKARQAAADVPKGLYSGLGGAVLMLHRLRHQAAQNAIDRLLDGPLPRSPGLFGGLTGLAHLLLDIGIRDEGLALAGKTAERIGEHGLLDRPGLMWGWSGPAVLFARCARLTGDSAWAEAAERAVRSDLRHGRMVDGTLQMHSSNRLLAYVAEGSAGVALAAMALPDAQASRLEADRIVTAAAKATDARVVIHGGLFNGRAGLAYFLSHAATRHAPWLTAAHEHMSSLALHVAPHNGARVLLGDQLVRLSTDLATGSAGALLAQEAVKNPGSCMLPGAHSSYG
ncbi:class III lanthionine synthetase LanKC [Streptomyces sp. NBC_00878]|uniref:class III lanthionine synthetase LanKC n=1 Tax=Streptomyces sp. NBC_00878 TaxID=2975854 RepID=UPI002256DB4E|nr:class III lanthionine synthetase LanKC [Streptomyces sp. NBC_00878]MCX4910616.1 class III lanthionine synthetase LanKC [Streptomyces sp. NBC_00878]